MTSSMHCDGVFCREELFFPLDFHRRVAMSLGTGPRLWRGRVSYPKKRKMLCERVPALQIFDEKQQLLLLNVDEYAPSGRIISTRCGVDRVVCLLRLSLKA